MTTLRAGNATSVGQVRSINQDSFLAVPEANLYGVADGIGGNQGGEVASALAVEVIAQHAEVGTLDALVDRVRVANRRIFEQAGADPRLLGMGTTFVGLQLVTGADGGDEIGWVNVGDSRLYLLRDDDIIQLSQDHSLVEELVRDGQITPEEARVHPQRNIITRSLGVDIDVRADVGTVTPFTGDRFLMCSDGLSNEVSSDQMASVLRRLADPDEAAAELVRLANEHGGRDNITVVIVDVTNDGGRALTASAALADEPTTAVAFAPPVATGADAGGDPGEEGAGPAAGGTGALGDRQAIDDFATETEDPFGDLGRERTKRWTWRVTAFLVALVLILVGTVAAIGWTARNSWYVSYDDAGNVTLYRGKPGGVLFFDPEVVQTSDLTRDDLGELYRDQVADGKEFDSEAAAERYLLALRSTVPADRDTTDGPDGSDEPGASTTTTDAQTTTSRVDATTAPATTTTAPPTTRGR